MNSFVEFLRAAIEMVVQSFSYESVFRYLRCGLSSLNREETDAMENYVLALGIRGLKRMRKRGRGGIAVSNRMESAAAQSSFGKNSMRRFSRLRKR